MEAGFESVKFLDYFVEIEDPRINRKKLYPLDEILFASLCGVICGAEGWNDLEMFCKSKIDFLRKYLPFKNGIPSDDTFARVFWLLNPKQFKECFIRWVSSLQEEIPELVALDGKELRRSFDKAKDKKALHMISAFATKSNIVLGQEKVDCKSNEITAIPKLLELLDLKGSLVTIDAMGCQKKIAKQIKDQDADYILALKGNQGNLHDEVKTFFTEEIKNNFEDTKCDFYEDFDKAHGRIEIRKCWSTEDVNWITNLEKWEGLKSISMVESTRIIDNKKTTETRFYISSIPANAKKISWAIRSHWRIENSLHWILDVTFNEDNSRIRRKNAPENMAIIRHAALNVLRKFKETTEPKNSIKGLRKKAGWDNNTLGTLILQKF